MSQSAQPLLRPPWCLPGMQPATGPQPPCEDSRPAKLLDCAPHTLALAGRH